MSKLGSVFVLPKVWLVNIILIQEKKHYHFFVIFIFAAFVASIRYMLELMLANRPIFSLNLSIVHLFIFYLHCIFIYTFILSLFIKDYEWKKSIHLVLIGVFLGIFPPFIDTVVYGIGNYQYGYVDNFTRDWRLLILNEEAHVPIGEALVLYLTMMFTALVVYIKTNSVSRFFLSLLVCYGFIFVYAALLPALFVGLANFYRNLEGVNVLSLPGVGIHEPVFQGFSNMFYISLGQLLLCVIIYFLLNPVLLKKLPLRLNHALPVVMTCLLGYSVFKELDAYIALVVSFFLLASIVTIFQNDYFDKEEDSLGGRSSYLTIDDVRFFNVSLLTVIALLASVGSLIAYMLLLFFIVSVIYNYDFYRGKRYFPANYKVEGIWGLSAYMGGMALVMMTGYSMVGDTVVTSEPVIIYGKGIQELSDAMSVSLFTSESLWMMFLVFGGWSIISVIKDYKDIESDFQVGNQTVYTLLMKKGKDIELFHKRYSLFLAIMMLLPIIWLAMREVSVVHVVFLVVMAIVFYFSITRKPSTTTVELSLLLISVYLLNLVLAAHFSH